MHIYIHCIHICMNTNIYRYIQICIYICTIDNHGGNGRGCGNSSGGNSPRAGDVYYNRNTGIYMDI
jgi:hypothetical protein